MVQIDAQPARVIGPGLTDGLERGCPVQRRAMLDENIGRDEGQDMRFQTLNVVLMQDFDDRIFRRVVHSFGRSVGLRTVRCSPTVLDTDVIEDVRTKKWLVRPRSVLRPVDEQHIVVGQDRIVFTGKSATASLRKADAPILPALSWVSTYINLETRSMVRNLIRLPPAHRSSQMFMCT